MIVQEYPLLPAPSQLVQLPCGALLLGVRARQETIRLFAQVDMAHYLESRTILMVRTGECLWQSPARHLGTVELHGVEWHVFAA